MKPLIYSGISRTRFEEIAEKAQAQTGLVFHGDFGAASAKGFTISWAYDEARQTLTFGVVSAPLFTSGIIAIKIAALMVSKWTDGGSG